MGFEDFKENIPADGDYKVHEDFIEWSFWVDVKNKLDEEIKEFKKLNGGAWMIHEILRQFDEIIAEI